MWSGVWNTFKLRWVTFDCLPFSFSFWLWRLLQRPEASEGYPIRTWTMMRCWDWRNLTTPCWNVEAQPTTVHITLDLRPLLVWEDRHFVNYIWKLQRDFAANRTASSSKSFRYGILHSTFFSHKPSCRYAYSVFSSVPHPNFSCATCLFIRFLNDVLYLTMQVTTSLLLGYAMPSFAMQTRWSFNNAIKQLSA